MKESRKKEWAPTLHHSMDGTGEHYAKWNKPGGERQIPYHFMYKWNLINETNKQAKYNQRLWNKEQSDSNQRGGGRGLIGDNRGGHQETGIKDTWTSQTGWVQGWEAGIGGAGGMVRWKWRQLYLSNNKNKVY